MERKRKNILVIAGSGRDVGKTTLGCQLINAVRHFQPVSVKVSPHLHSGSTEKGYCIIKEVKHDINKDSGRYLNAGAKTSFYVETTDEYLGNVWEELSGMISNSEPVIIESGGIHQVLDAGLFLFLFNPGHQPLKQKKRVPMEHADWKIDVSITTLEEIAKQIVFENHQWRRL